MVYHGADAAQVHRLERWPRVGRRGLRRRAKVGRSLDGDRAELYVRNCHYISER